MGWGTGQWGSSEWGVGEEEGLALVAALAVRDNLVRLAFNEPPLLDGLLGPNDGSDPGRYIITPVDGTLPEGETPRPVSVLFAEVATVAGSAGTQVDLVLDREMSPFPGRYTVAVNRLVSALSGAFLLIGSTSAPFDGLQERPPVERRDLIAPSRDIAKPQTQSALFDPLPVTDDPLILGSIPVDEQGDYAFDEGITNLRKRIFRRIFTDPNGFVHLEGYGVGLMRRVKRLARASDRAQIIADVVSQVSLEPDVVPNGVRATLTPDPRRPNLWRLKLRVKTTITDKTVDFDVPVGEEVAI